MHMQIQCSRCGRRSRKYAYNHLLSVTTKAPEEIIKAGWGSFGDAFYCPQCAKTWEKRNEKDRPLWGDYHTHVRILETMVGDLMQSVERLEGTFEP